MERLGLWGDGAPFKTFEAFLDTVHRKGLGALKAFSLLLSHVKSARSCACAPQIGGQLRGGYPAQDWL